MAICALNPLGVGVDTSIVALHEATTESTTRPLVTCPLCDDQFLVARAYKAHLDERHRLTDDAGTDTELSLLPPAPPPEPEPEPEPPARSRWGRDRWEKPAESAAPEEAPVFGPPAPAAPPAPPQAQRPSRSRPPLVLPKPKLPARPAWLAWPRLPSRPARSRSRWDPAALVRGMLPRARPRWLRLPHVDAGGRYPLALRFGDVALYVPGALLVLAGVAGRGSDTGSVALSLAGAILVLVGMVLPTLHRKTFSAAASADADDDAQGGMPADHAHGPRALFRPLEEVLLSLPAKSPAEASLTTDPPHAAPDTATR